MIRLSYVTCKYFRLLLPDTVCICRQRCRIARALLTHVFLRYVVFIVFQLYHLHVICLLLTFARFSCAMTHSRRQHDTTLSDRRSTTHVGCHRSHGAFLPSSVSLSVCMRPFAWSLPCKDL